jgi:probable rRNA maturation factor
MINIDNLPGINVGEHIENVIKKAAEKVLSMEKSEGCELSIFLTDDEDIQRLNNTYRSVNKPTDVLAFAMREGAENYLNNELLGDVVVSIPRAEYQSSAYGHSLELEIALLISHGVLHLLGYDHEKKNELLVMQQKQKEVLQSLGYDTVNSNQ